MKTLSILTICLMIAVLTFTGGVIVGIKWQEKQIPTIRQIQRKVGTEDDGLLGKKTQAAWELAYYEKYGIWPY